MRDLGNTVLVVEHDEDTMRAADWIVDLGPAPASTAATSSARGAARRSCRCPDVAHAASTCAASAASPCRRARRPGNGK